MSRKGQRRQALPPEPPEPRKHGAFRTFRRLWPCCSGLGLGGLGLDLPAGQIVCQPWQAGRWGSGGLRLRLNVFKLATGGLCLGLGFVAPETPNHQQCLANCKLQPVAVIKYEVYGICE